MSDLSLYSIYNITEFAEVLRVPTLVSQMLRLQACITILKVDVPSVQQIHTEPQMFFALSYTFPRPLASLIEEL